MWCRGMMFYWWWLMLRFRKGTIRVGHRASAGARGPCYGRGPSPAWSWDPACSLWSDDVHAWPAADDWTSSRSTQLLVCRRLRLRHYSGGRRRKVYSRVQCFNCWRHVERQKIMTVVYYTELYVLHCEYIFWGKPTLPWWVISVAWVGKFPEISFGNFSEISRNSYVFRKFPENKSGIILQEISQYYKQPK